ncbi:MAG: DNA/RNA nuclease SfsA, partial [Rhodospirillaceae bacterium]|nr:DNA/RNA nuclease SfsA [Rhodospirillaceae bacterium]
PKRKLRWTWELVRDADTGSLVGINTGRANAVVEEALRAGLVDPALAAPSIRREVRYGDGSRVDFLLTGDDGQRCFLEVKSVTLRRSAAAPHIGEFPDAVTARGARHLRELAAVRAGGDRAMLLYLVQRGDCEAVRLAADIDPAYAEAARDAQAAGVDFRAVDCRVTPEEIAVRRPLPVGI